MNGKALEQRTALAVSAWPVPLFPLGFSASNPVTGAESLACWGSLVPSLGGGASPGWVDSLLWSACLGWRPPHLGLYRGGDLCGLYSALSQDGKLVVEDIPLVVWGLCFGKVGGVISFLFGPVRGCPRMGPQCLLTPPVSASSIYAAVVYVSGG